MSIPKYDELMNPVLKAMHELGGSASISELEDKVAQILNLSEKDINETHKGNTTKLSYRMAWARSYLKAFGVLENSTRGVWSLTPEGQKTKAVDTEQVKNFVRKSDKTSTKSKAKKDKGVDPPVDKVTLWRTELLATLLKLKPDAFERLTKRLLRECGFVQVEVTGRSGDCGIDGKGVVKIAGILSFPIVFQCKKYEKGVPSKAVRDLRGAMVGRADKGLLITTGYFTADAKKEANRDGAPPIDLIDGEQLLDMIKELEIGVKTEKKVVEEVTIEGPWFENL